MTQGDEMLAERKAMVAEIEAEVADTQKWLGKRTLDPRVAAAMQKVPRHLFMPESTRQSAYENRPHPNRHAPYFLLQHQIFSKN